MPKLYGAQRLVLQAIHDAQGETSAFIEDAKIAQATQIALGNVRNWLETLEGDGYANVARTTAGLSASITANGKLALGLYEPFSPPTPGLKPPTPAETPGSFFAANPIQDDAGQAAPGQPIRLFYSYSHKDEALRDELEEALALLKRQGLIAAWHDRMIGAGEEWRGEIDKNLEEAQVILLLVSSSFLASDYCWDVETKRAVERHDRGEAKVIPVILRPCDWRGAPFGKLQALPRDAKAVTSWANKDEAWTDVAVGIRRAVEALKAKPREVGSES